MAFGFRKFLSGLNIVPKVTSTVNSAGDLDFDTTANKLNLHNGTISSPVVTEAGTANLTNKSINASANTISNLTNANLSGSAGISNANLAPIPANTIIGNNTGLPSVPIDLTISQVNTLLGTTGAAVTVGALDAQIANAQGQALVGGVLSAQSADATHPGLINNVAQTFSGQKTFSTGITGNLTGNVSGSSATVSGIVTPDHGGTGIANNVAATTTRVGNFAKTETLTGVTSVTYPQAGTLSTLAGVETLSNKTFGDAPTFTEIVTPASPAVGFNKIYPKADNNFYTLDSSGSEKLLGSGGGSSLVNFVGLNTSFLPVNTNDSNFESSIGNWAAFATPTILAQNLGSGSGAANLGATTNWGGQSFTALQTSTILSAQLNMQYGGVAPTGTFTLNLYADNGSGLPGALLETSGTINASTLTTIYAPIIFNFSGTTSLTSGLIYHIIVNTTNIVFGAGTIVSLQGGALGYAGGQVETSTNSGTSYTAGGGDLYFIVNPVINVTLTGGSPVTTITRTTAVGQVLDGIASGLITKDAANRFGEGVSLLINVPPAYRAENATIQIPYKLISGTLIQGDLKIYVYDVTNSQLIIPTNNNIISPTGIIQSTFYVPANCAQLRIGFYFASTSTSAILLSFDDVVVSTSNAALGMVTTDWSNNLTFVLNNAGVTSQQRFFYRRVGDTMEFVGDVAVGTVVAATASLSLPSGYFIDSTKLPANLNGTGVGFSTDVSPAATTLFYAASRILTSQLFYDGSDTSKIYFAIYSNSGAYGKANGTDIWLSGEIISIRFSIPIAGWSSNQQIGSYTDAIVAANVTGATAAITSTYSDVSFTTVGQDTHNAYSSPNYKVPVTGYYNISGQLYMSATTVLVNDTRAIALFNTTTSTIILENTFSTAAGVTSASALQFEFNSVYLTAGTQIKIQVKSTDSGPIINASSTNNFLAVQRISGSTIVQIAGGPNSEIFVSNGNGYGSTGTVIRRFLTVNKSLGNAITYVSDAVNGDSFQINANGVYSITYTDYKVSTAGQDVGISVNASSLTIGIGALTFAQGFRGYIHTTSGDDTTLITRSLNLNSGDIVRAHVSSNSPDALTNANLTTFSITKVS